MDFLDVAPNFPPFNVLGSYRWFIQLLRVIWLTLILTMKEGVISPQLEGKHQDKEISTIGKQPPFTMNVQLNIVWLIVVGLSFGTRMWQLTVPKHVV